jgi:hypothetical protein
VGISLISGIILYPETTEDRVVRNLSGNVFRWFVGRNSFLIYNVNSINSGNNNYKSAF